MTDVKLKYTCIAAPPENVYLGIAYTLGKDLKGYYFTDGKNIEYADIGYIKMLFTPIDLTWEKALKVETKNTEK